MRLCRRPHTMPQGFDIDWSQAAIVAAVIAGVFALTKELVTFFLDRLKARWNTALAHRRTKAKLSRYYFKLAVGAGKSLERWADSVHELKEMQLPLGPEAPSLEFLSDYADSQLAGEVGELVDECPELLFSYDQVMNLQRTLTRVETEERDAFANAPFFYSYPRTRRTLGLLLQHSVAALEESCGHLPINFWDPDQGPRATFMKEVKGLRAQLKRISIPSSQEAVREALNASDQLYGSRQGAEP
jgi:hypothetical protein